MHLRKGPLEKKRNGITDTEKSFHPPRSVPKKTSQIHLAQGLEAEIETKEPEKDYNSWQHKAGRIFCAIELCFLLHLDIPLLVVFLL